MRGKKNAHVGKVCKVRREARRNLGKIIRKVAKNTPDRETPCKLYVNNNCILYSGKDLRKRCPNGLGYLRVKGQNPNNWSPCDVYVPYNEESAE